MIVSKRKIELEYTLGLYQDFFFKGTLSQFQLFIVIFFFCLFYDQVICYLYIFVFLQTYKLILALKIICRLLMGVITSVNCLLL